MDSNTIRSIWNGAILFALVAVLMLAFAQKSNIDELEAQVERLEARLESEEAGWGKKGDNSNYDYQLALAELKKKHEQAMERIKAKRDRLKAETGIPVLDAVGLVASCNRDPHCMLNKVKNSGLRVDVTLADMDKFIASVDSESE